jgi:endonuclease YncB( thermonuclease family)
LFGAFIIFLALPAAAQTVTGKVVGISDGDTITLLTPERSQLKVRLDGIDAPEEGQEFSAASKRALSSLVAGKTVTLQVSGTDRYGRALGTILADGQNVNLLMVRAGFAWHYVKYSDDPALAAAERTARAERRGLWAGFNPTAPWDYRALKKQPQTATGGHWLNTSSGVRHNSSCKWFGQTSRGRPCGPDEGKPCGICGG